VAVESIPGTRKQRNVEKDGGLAAYSILGLVAYSISAAKRKRNSRRWGWAENNQIGDLRIKFWNSDYLTHREKSAATTIQYGTGRRQNKGHHHDQH
jgi:hypothetical protein